jgi:hypothetical protein
MGGADSIHAHDVVDEDIHLNILPSFGEHHNIQASHTCQYYMAINMVPHIPFACHLRKYCLLESLLLFVVKQY